MTKKNRKSDVVSRGRVIAYTRVSTEKQADQGLSLEAQTERLKKYAEAFGLEIVSHKYDAASASTLESRTGLQDALDMIESGAADGLLVVKLDRLTRSVRDLAYLVEEYFTDRFALISVSECIDTSTAAGRMMLNMLTTIAQWEREAIGERTAAVMQHMKAAGLFTGGFPPYGWYLRDGKLEESDDEQALIIRARACRAAGMSLRAVAATIGKNPRTGRSFSASQIAGLL